MVKTIKIKENVFNLSTSGAMLINYKQQFGNEYYEDLEKIASADKNNTKDALLCGYKLIWAMSKAYDSSIPDPDCWISSFSEFPLLELIPEAVNLLTSSFDKVNKSDDEEVENDKKMSSENLVACCLACGMNISDINTLDIAFLINSVSEFVKIKTGKQSESESVHIRKATQADFDAF